MSVVITIIDDVTANNVELYLVKKYLENVQDTLEHHYKKRHMVNRGFGNIPPCFER
jgi:hypothetical protein